MKKLLLAVLFLGGMTAQANTVTDLDHTTERGIRYNQPQSITFIERGVEYVVFVNGQFDFAPVRSQYRNQGRRGYTNAPGHTYGVNYKYGNRGFVKYDRYGDISRVGRSFLNYNRRGQVNQIGAVSLRYKNGRLTRVGNMNLIYNRRGYVVDLRGYVHHDRGYRNNNFRNRIELNDGYMTQRNYRKNNKKWYGKNNSKKYKKNKNYRYKKNDDDDDDWDDDDD